MTETVTPAAPSAPAAPHVASAPAATPTAPVTVNKDFDWSAFFAARKGEVTSIFAKAGGVGLVLSVASGQVTWWQALIGFGVCAVLYFHPEAAPIMQGAAKEIEATAK